MVPKSRNIMRLAVIFLLQAVINCKPFPVVVKLSTIESPACDIVSSHSGRILIASTHSHPVELVSSWRLQQMESQLKMMHLVHNM